VFPRAFYARSTVQVARDLLGAIVDHRGITGRIVEVEAYLGVNDGAAHSARGLTPATRVIFGEPGHAYVYLIYGMYECLNLVAERAGVAGCVLIRALEPIAGVEAMQRRRPTARSVREIANGPGKLTRALGITRKLNGADVTRGALTVHAGDARAFEIAVSPRIGITKSADLPLRFYIRGNEFVSRA
jgi:DNA-3-methyladenine glycosylase